MTNDEIKQFYRDIADVCMKHDISGVAGVWFGGAKSDEFGQLLYWNITDSDMKMVIKDLSEKYEYWAKHTLGHVRRSIGNIHEMRSNKGDSENN